MFISLILMCSLQTTDDCRTMMDRKGHQTEEACLRSLEQGFKYYESMGYSIEGYDCYKWNTSIFDEKA